MEKSLYMAIDLSNFFKINITDSCAVWNVLSSSILFHAATGMNCVFSLTAFVNYECLFKSRSSQSSEEETLKNKLREQQNKGDFQVYHLTIEDLQDLKILEQRKALGKGELSSIAFAKRTRQAFLTDDQGARKLASQIMGSEMVQTTPPLLGWLIFTQRVSESDKHKIIEDHESFKRPLRPYFEKVYYDALQFRLTANPPQN
jgi:predicted nucleic acid-binding protein